MTETRRRIKAYQAALPGLRERLISVAVLLAMSVAMISTATYAWLTISYSPEIRGMNTTVAANGNLEIALATGDGKHAPGDSKVGDSSATKGNSVASSNITWGNLINLADPVYGLDNLIMRPAQLNTASLLSSPLYGAIYGEDGRVTQLSSNFGYTIWTPPAGEKPGYFAVSEDYGVRAISSTKIEAVGAEALYVNMVTNATNRNLAAANYYVNLGNNSRYMPSLATMMGLYMTARMNSDDASLSNPSCDIADIQNLRDMYADFLVAFDMEAEAMADLVNLQLFLQKGEGNYEIYTAEKIYASTTAGLKALGVQLSDLDQFVADRQVIASDLEKLKNICASGTSLTWKDSGLNDIVNNLVNVGACTIGSDNTPISSIGASNALSYLSGTQEARITNGILYRFEERTGGYIEVKNLGISATVKRMGITVPATVKVNIKTTAPRDYSLFNNDLIYAKSLNTGDYKGGVPVAEDTYGLAVDLWVRTNAIASYLTLEGNILYETSEVRAMGKDVNGNAVELYTVTISGTDEQGNAVSTSVDVYRGMASATQEDGTIVQVEAWLDAQGHSPMTEEELGSATPLPKMETVITVTGYEGENRVWGDNELLSADSTTQGSGSCYVYYADSPEDQARSLKLLEAFNVAFVDDKGKLLASAIMDTEHHYAASGRVIVPLVLNPSQSVNLGEDYEGNLTYAITALEQNVPTRITALVYLDGTKLTNQEVLAAADIQGQLNIQFGSTEVLNPISNEVLENAERRISASVDKTAFDYDTTTEPMTANVTVSVDGEEANSVSAFFLRAINSTQGAREQEMAFESIGNGKWTGSHTFTAPGNYLLRTVRLDGVDYDLATPLEVTVSGFSVQSLSCVQSTENNHVSVMTAANSSSVDLMLKFATNDISKMPSTVRGRYISEDGVAVNVDFAYNSATGLWLGSTTFHTSGDYTLQYLVINGDYTELDSALWQTASVVLGMRVAVYTTSPHSFKYIPSEMTENEKLLKMRVKIMDNTGKEMPGLLGAKLTYNMKGSGIRTLDTDLTWNGVYYVGELTTIGPGIWQFANVVVGNNVLTNATASPTFTVQSPEPPSYHDHNTVAYQYNPNGDAVMNVQITNSSAATVWALLQKEGQAEGVWVEGKIGGELELPDGRSANHWYFSVPKDIQGYQDGNWTLKILKLWNVFDSDGSEYTEEKPLVLDVSGTNNVTKVVNRVFVSFKENMSQDFGKDATGTVTGKFMDSYTVSGLNVTLSDFEGGPISNLSAVTLKYTYGNNSAQYGGYTSAQLTNAVADFTVELKDDGSGMHFAQEGSHTLRYAGSYATEFSFEVDGVKMSYKAEKLPVNTPVFNVYSIAPTVKITDAYYASASSETAATFTDSSVTVYCYEYTKTKTECGKKVTYDAYKQPHVTLTLSGYGNASGATMTFAESTGATVLLYTSGGGTSSVSTFTWTADGSCKRWVGYYKSQSKDDDRTTAGNLAAANLILTYEGVEYQVATPIAINNPN